MPFRVQCPHSNCRKYMLLEDESRGTTVNCLVCRQPITIEGTGSGSRESANLTRPGSGSAGHDEPAKALLLTCPNSACQAPLRLASLKPGQAIRCPKCKQVFKP